MTGDEKHNRVQQMVLDMDKWSMTPSDKDALRHVLGMVNMLASRLASATGVTVPDVLSKSNEVVQARKLAMETTETTKEESVPTKKEITAIPVFVYYVR